MAERRRTPAPTQAAFVLQTYDWSESSLILDLYTREEGRQAVVAKGAKRPYSQLRSVLLPFQGVTVQLGRAREPEEEDGVRVLKTAEWAAGSVVMPPERLLSAYYLNELLMKFLLRGEPQPALFDHYRSALEALSGGGSDRGLDARRSPDLAVAPVLRCFELCLLSGLGLLADLAQEGVSGRLLEADRGYVLKAELGLMPALGEEVSVSGAAWIGLQAALMSGWFAAVLQWTVAYAAALGPMMRLVLANHLAGTGLRTRELMQELRRYAAIP